MIGWKAAKDAAQAFLNIAAALGLCGGILWFMFEDLIKDELTGDLAREIGELSVSIDSLVAQTQQPQLLEFKGSGVVLEDTVSPGENVHVLYVLKRNVSCDTTVRVRFWNVDQNNFMVREIYEVVAIKAPVAPNAPFTTFVAPVFIPETLPPGEYMYIPEIKPEECGIYKTIVGPTTNTFKVVPKREASLSDIPENL